LQHRPPEHWAELEQVAGTQTPASPQVPPSSHESAVQAHAPPVHAGVVPLHVAQLAPQCDVSSSA
jgi:hypothetical protein